MRSGFKKLALVYLLGMLLIHGLAFSNARDQLRQGYPDFTSLYGAGRSMVQGHGKQLYEAGEQWRSQQEFAKRVRRRGEPLPFLRLPWEALLFSLFSWLPYFKAYLLWTMINIVAATSVPLLLRRELSEFQPFPRWLLALLPLAATPVYLALLQGQDSGLLLLIYCLAYRQLRRDGDWGAGCWLALGLMKPQLVLPFVAIYWLRGKRRFVAGFAAASAILLLVSAAVSGWSELIRFPAYVWSLEQHANRGIVLAHDSPNLRGLVESCVHSFLSPSATLAVVGLLSAAAVALTAASKPPADGLRAKDLMFSQAVAASFLVSYHAFAYDLSLMVLPAFVLANLVIEDSRSRGEHSAVRLLAPVAALLFGPIFVLLFPDHHCMELLALVLLFWIWQLSREISKSRIPTSRLVAVGGEPGG
jgi:hypothetical protein